MYQFRDPGRVLKVPGGMAYGMFWVISSRQGKITRSRAVPLPDALGHQVGKRCVIVGSMLAYCQDCLVSLRQLFCFQENWVRDGRHVVGSRPSKAPPDGLLASPGAPARDISAVAIRASCTRSRKCLEGAVARGEIIAVVAKLKSCRTKRIAHGVGSLLPCLGQNAFANSGRPGPRRRLNDARHREAAVLVELKAMG